MNQRVYYYENDRLKIEPSISRYKFVLKYVKDKSIIDIGCGARMGPYILSEAASNVVGIDNSEEAIQFCKRKWPRRNISYLTADATKIPFEDNKFDIAVSFEVIEHIEDYVTYLKEVKRILRPDGIFILSTPNRPVASPSDKLSNVDHFREFDSEELRNILKKHFNEIVFYGQFPSERILRIEESKRKNLKTLQKKSPRLLKKILPAVVKDILIKKYQNLSVRIKENIDIDKIEEEDFFFSNKNVEKARYFLAICRNK